MKGRVRIINESRYADEEVNALVRFGLQELEIPRKGLLVVVTNTKHSYRQVPYSGTAYNRRSADKRMTKNESYHIAVRIGPPSAFPIREFRRNGVLYDYKTWQETIVGVAAHEARHIQDYFEGRGHDRTWIEAETGWRAQRGSGQWRRVGDQRIEPRCAAFEVYMLRKFREQQIAAKREP